MNGAVRPNPILLKRQNLAMAWALLSFRAEIERMRLAWSTEALSRQRRGVVLFVVVPFDLEPEVLVNRRVGPTQGPESATC
ncbi:hypothetical protein-transmembrane prediction [Rhodopirellula baltica SH 1]|uniref:Uncharacterized protein n=1 Tax=Rhodopirellula baltica (strain DSM 10527 / NCIMB 13988 / SH1) TaxID=243090 RepID=Q7UHI3_RHOBA|nr:hypothetical protein-transmembrane prediction [Rhodopirellula baltica SH 1]